MPGFRVDYDHGTGTWDCAPRVSMRQQLGDLVLKGGIGRFYEPPSPNQIDLAAAETMLWTVRLASCQRA